MDFMYSSLDFIFAIIELFSLDLTADALIHVEIVFIQGVGQFEAKY